MIFNEVLARSILTKQAETAHDLRQARATEFMRLLRAGNKTTEAWQMVELATEKEARAAWEADVDAKVLWMCRGLAEPAGDLGGGDLV